MPEIQITAPTDKELFSLSWKRIFAACLCGVGIHQRWLYTDHAQHVSFWYCAWCGKISNRLEGIDIK